MKARRIAHELHSWQGKQKCIDNVERTQFEMDGLGQNRIESAGVTVEASLSARDNKIAFKFAQVALFGDRAILKRIKKFISLIVPILFYFFDYVSSYIGLVVVTRFLEFFGVDLFGSLNTTAAGAISGLFDLHATWVGSSNDQCSISEFNHHYLCIMEQRPIDYTRTNFIGISGNVAWRNAAVTYLNNILRYIYNGVSRLTKQRITPPVRILYLDSTSIPLGDSDTINAATSEKGVTIIDTDLMSDALRKMLQIIAASSKLKNGVGKIELTLISQADYNVVRPLREPPADQYSGGTLDALLNRVNEVRRNAGEPL